jgi:hypothetical protein
MIRDSRIFEPTNWTSLGTDGLISSNISKIGTFNVDIYVDALIK